MSVVLVTAVAALSYGRLELTLTVTTVFILTELIVF